MKAKLIKDLDAAPSAGDDEQIKEREDGTRYWPEGSVIDNPRAFRLVQQGVATPEDDECTQRCSMTLQQMADAQLAQKRVAAGIHPDDYAAFDAGLMTGYDEDGKHIPGPNYKPDDDDTLSE